eukprot:6201188-Pleurochrysis_carterae.AAC.2
MLFLLEVTHSGAAMLVAMMILSDSRAAWDSSRPMSGLSLVAALTELLVTPLAKAVMALVVMEPAL